MTDHPDIRDIRNILSQRRDIYLHARNATAPDGTPPILGVQLRRAIETEVRGADSYHPFNYKGWLYYGQAFAINRPNRGKLTKDQTEWAEDFKAMGGVYVAAKDMRDVLVALGKEPAEMQEYLDRAPMKRF